MTHPTEEQRLLVTTGLPSIDLMPPGATLSLNQREPGAWEQLIDDTAFRMVTDALDTGGDSIGSPVWVTLYVEDRVEPGRPLSFTRIIGHIVAATNGSDGPSFHFGNGEKIPAVHIAGLHL